MPLCISIRFLTGRAHLHHWHAHHSDGKVDWPPSPWRLLRALVAAAGTGMTSLPEPLDETIGDMPDDSLPVSRLAASLAALAAPPRIWLPRTGGGHTRQFLPKADKATGSAVFDTFATVSKEVPIVFEWPELHMTSNDQRFIDLQTLLRRLTYFGRAESWCEAAAQLQLPSSLQPEKTHWCCSAVETSTEPAGREHVDYTLERKLTLETSLGTVRGQVVDILANCDFKIFERKTARGGKTTEKWVKLKPALLEGFKKNLAAESEELSLLRCLLRSSGEDIKDGLERPVGTRWVQYAVPRAIHQLPPNAFRRSPRLLDASRVTLMRFALNTASASRPVLPRITDTLLIADKFRAAALAWHGHLFSKLTDPKPRNLRGREDNNSIARNGHDHAHFWPTDEDGDGFIDHITVLCSAGLQGDEVESLRRLLRLKQRGSRPDLLVTPVFEGMTETFEPWKGAAMTFVSATPYFPDAHITPGRRSGARLKLAKVVMRSLREVISLNLDAPPAIHQIVAKGNISPSFIESCAPITHNAFPNSVAYTPDRLLPPGGDFLMATMHGQNMVRPIDFCVRRKGEIVTFRGRYLQIEFPAPQPRQPFAIGKHAHFGLGLFVPA